MRQEKFKMERQGLIEIGDETYCYQYDSSNNTLTKSTDLAVHQVKVLSDGENGEVLRMMRVADGTTVGGMISDGQYTYSYETEDRGVKYNVCHRGYDAGA